MSYRDLINERGKELYYPDFKTKRSSRRWYQHDIDIIIYSDMFRKMQRKSQLLSINDPVARSRLIHTFEVVRIAKEISEKLKLNAELTEAIALAHDFGNVAYGKVADIFLKDKTSDLFRHEEASALMLKMCASRYIPEKYRERAKNAISSNPSVTHFIEITEFPYRLEVYQYKKSIYYVCSSPEVIDGVVKHGTNQTSFTLEGQVVNYADNIAYLIQDISDFEATGIFDRAERERYRQCLADFETLDENKLYPLSGIVGETTSIRTATLIERFVSHNQMRFSRHTHPHTHSPFFDAEIPILIIEPLVRKAIDRCWEFKNEFYENDLISISNVTSRLKMQQIWDILDSDSAFVENNGAYTKFMKSLSSPLFNTFRKEKSIDDSAKWDAWKKAFFIAHLTCDEIDFIINSFLERDYVFDLSLPSIKGN